MELSKIDRFPIFDVNESKVGCHLLALPADTKFLCIRADENFIVLHSTVANKEITNLIGTHFHIFVEGLPIPTYMLEEAEQYLGHVVINDLVYHVFYCGAFPFDELEAEPKIAQANMFGAYSDVLMKRANKLLREIGNPNFPDPVLPESLNNLLNNL